MKPNEFMISLHPEHWKSMVRQRKSAELRTRPMKGLQPGSRVWIYAAGPVSAVVGSCVVKSAVSVNTSMAWLLYGQELGISKSLFDAYVGDRQEVFIIRWATLHYNEHIIPLAKLRELLPDFRPPQFYMKLDPKTQATIERQLHVT